MKIKDILGGFVMVVLIFIAFCNVMGFLMGFLSDCKSDRIIAKNFITGSGYKLSCSDSFSFTNQ